MKLVTLMTVAFVALAAAVGVTIFAVDDPGYVLIARAPWTIELSFTLFVILIVLTFLIVYFLLRTLARLWGTPRAIGSWRRERSIQKRQQSLVRGYAHMLEGDWIKAEKDLIERIDESQTPLLGYVGAAYSAQQQGDVEKRDNYLAQANDADPKRAVGIGLMQARMQYHNGQLEAALASLEPLRDKAPKNLRVLALLADCLRGLRKWNKLVELLSALRKNNVFPEHELERRTLEAYQGLFSTAQTLTQGSAEIATQSTTLKNTWEQLPKRLKREPELIAAYAAQLTRLGEMDRAERLLRGAIKRQWDARLVSLYGSVRTTDIQGQFKTAELWTAAHPDDPDLMLTLGRLAMENQLWGKARSYLETCIANGGPDEAHRVLGSLLEYLGETDQALHCYRQGLDRAFPTNLPSLPEVETESSDDATPPREAATA